MSNLISKFKGNKRSAFFLKYFVILAAMIVAGFIITGSALMVFVYNFSKQETLQNLSKNSINISNIAQEILCSDLALHNPEATALLFYNNIKLSSDASNTTIFMCNDEGDVIACADTMKKPYETVTEAVCEEHKNFHIPKGYIVKAEEIGYADYTTLSGAFTETHAVAISPIMVENQLVGFTVCTSPVSGEITTYFIKLLTSFLSAAVIALVILTLALFFLADKMTKPVRELANAARCYSSGDFSYKVPEPTEQNEMAELIIEFNSMADSLEALENSRRNFVSSVSHEFKTPMTTIGGFINGILDGTIPPEKQNYYLEIVSSEVKRLSKMVNAMLNISRIETGNLTLNIDRFNISNNLLTTFLTFEQLITEKNITVEGLEELEALIVPADQSMLDQVIYNLVDNAVKFTDNNGKIKVETKQDSQSCYFSIRNTGSGIPPEHIKNIFDRFYKVDGSRSADTKSTGLGLHLVKKIVELHGGRITVKSKENKFTEFTVKLPK
jgi:signal transduction histidine kinase